jgi:hypothetical protein
VIERHQLLGRRLLVIQDGSDQAIDRFSVGNAIETIFDGTVEKQAGLARFVKVPAGLGGGRGARAVLHITREESECRGTSGPRA